MPPHPPAAAPRFACAGPKPRALTSAATSAGCRRQAGAVPSSRRGHARTRAGQLLCALGLTGLLLSCRPIAYAGELDEARIIFLKGDYAECARLAEKALQERGPEEEWRLLQIQSLLALGRYPAAVAAVEEGLSRTFGSVRLRVLGYEVFRQSGDPGRARRMLDEINSLAASRGRWAYQDAPNLVALGRAALLLGAEPRRVLEQFFDRAKRAEPTNREVVLAIGQLALDKDDLALAAKTFGDALKQLPSDPDLHYGLARALHSGNRQPMLASLQAALALNPNHVPSLLLLADHAIDAEDYSAAEKTVAKALQVNPLCPEAWAYRAVLAHLRHDLAGESQARSNALRAWPANPVVDHLIGRKLSQKYRFAEGAARQRQALAFDPDYLPARLQLAQDLLRLGNEPEGWRLAQSVHEADGYNVEAYNLTTLHDTLGKFRTLTNEHFLLRMAPKEADLYGARALALLERARATLSQKYGWELTRPVVVEVFPNQKDFGVRTFGMPENPGFAGVCFGHVITANSPASQTAHPVNWEAVLWHEFAHVVTLGLTHNKMPRWLSEGISVFEERQANPAWGQAMTPRFREMVLGEELHKVSELSAAFLTPPSELHLQFAYFQAGLVVEFLVERFGLEALKAILRDLGAGVEINAAIVRHTASMTEVEKEFAAFARRRAESLAPGLDWTKPEPAELARADETWFAKHPKNFYALTTRARNLLRAKQWTEAKAPLTTLLQEYPTCAEALAMLAQAHRGLGETAQEKAVLARWAALEANALEAYRRLLELAEAEADWPVVIENAERYLAVNPLLPQPYRALARASEATGQVENAVRAYRILLDLDPPDPAEAHYRLARLLHQRGDPAAKRHLLQALEEAPRYREALRLLLEMHRPAQPDPAPRPTPATGAARAELPSVGP